MNRLSIILFLLLIFGCGNQNNGNDKEEIINDIEEKVSDDSVTKNFKDQISFNKKYDCFVSIYSPNADIDLFTHNLKEGDSSNITFEKWGQDELEIFIKNLNEYCIDDEIEKFNFSKIDSIMFKDNKVISVELHKIYRKDSIFELISIMYGYDGSAIISYKEMLNKNEAQHKNKTH